jgi:hypothetical protein
MTDGAVVSDLAVRIIKARRAFLSNAIVEIIKGIHAPMNHRLPISPE